MITKITQHIIHYHTMIIRFPRVIYHKSIFQANLVKLFLWKFLTFLDNISICQAVSLQPTEFLLEIFYFWCGGSVAVWLTEWCMKPETTNVHVDDQTSSRWPKPKTEFLGTPLLTLFNNQSKTRVLVLALAWLGGQVSPAGNGLLTETISLSPLHAPF